MLKLSNFFQPLNLINLMYFLFAIIFFDILGTLIKSFFIKKDEVDSETRLVNWLMGLGFFIFIWFILGFLIVPTQINLLISMVVLLILSLPYYLKNKKYSPFIKLFKPLILPILLIVPFLPSTFVRASLPPYVWDEMAYHFISPYVALHSISQYWQFNGDFYGNLPRLMDTLYILSFSLTRTYSVVRLIQFSILVTSLFSAFLLIKKLLGRIPSLLFILIFLSLPLNIPYNATIGYVDFPAFSFLLLGLVFGITSLFSNTHDYIILSLLFWAMSIGTKYTTLIPFGAFAVSFTVIYWIKNRSFANLFDKKTFLRIVLGLVIFGGYWYIKNLIVYGNPIFPFLFPCWGKFASDCAVGSSFFGTWTQPVVLHNLYPIIKTLLSRNILLHIALVLSMLVVTFFGNKKSRLILLMLTLSFGTEILVLKYFSGFDGRYQQYLVFTLILIIVLFAAARFNHFIARFGQMVVILALAGSCIFFYFQNVVYLDSFRFMEPYKIDYAVGRVSIYDWVKNIFGDDSAPIIWCDNPPGGQVALARFDPELIWDNYAGLTRVYMANCSYLNPPLEGVAINQVLKLAIEQKMQFWITSKSKCGPDVQINQTSGKLYLKELNNLIICNSVEVQPDLYYFDYKKLE